MPKVNRRMSIELRSEGEFTIRGSIVPTERYLDEHVELTVETLGAAPRLLRFGARRFLDAHGPLCFSPKELKAMVRSGVDVSGGAIVPDIDGPAPNAFRVQIRMPFASDDHKYRRKRNPVDTLQITAGILSSIIQSVLDEKRSLLPPPDPKLVSYRSWI